MREDNASTEKERIHTSILFIEQLNATKKENKWPLIRQWMEDEPLPFFKQLRTHLPIVSTPECTLLSLYDDVTEALNHPSIFTVSLYKPKMGDFLMTEDDTDLHHRDRDIMMSLLKREDLPRIREYVANACSKILNNSEGSIELIENYARIVPVSLVQDVFGLDGIRKKTLLKWSYLNQYDAFNNQHFQNYKGHETIEAARKKSNPWVFLYGLSMLVRKLFFLYIKKPKKDTVTRMLNEHSIFKKGFGPIRQAINSAGLLIGTVETTSEAVSNSLNQLFLHPKHLEQAITLAKSDDIQAFDNLVWETLRSQPIAPYLMRKTSADYTIAQGTNRETLIPKNTTVLCLIASAMFDSKAFKDPDKFDPTRGYGNSFQFGYASHECIGKMIGMVMIPEMVRQILLKPNIQQLSKQNKLGGPFPKHHHLGWSTKGNK